MKNWHLLNTFWFIAILLPVEVRAACSCEGYYSSRAQPEWVMSESIAGDVISSVGSSRCTGLKSLDEKRADEQARISLTKLLSTQVTTREQSTLYAQNSLNSGSYSAKSSLSSQQLLTNAAVFDRWADVKNCVVYSGIRVSMLDIKKANQEVKAKQAKQLVHQPICISVSGETPGFVMKTVLSGLVQKGFLVSEQDAQCTVFLSVDNKQLVSSSTKAITQIDTTLKTAEKLLWQKTYDGKGISFTHRSQRELYDRAVSDTVDSLLADLSHMQLKEIK